MKKLLAFALMSLLAGSAWAGTFTFGWEDGTSTVLSVYPLPDGMICTNVSAPEPVYDGTYSLKCVDNAISGTPQGYIAWIRGLQDGDMVYAGFWRYDITPGASPSCRIWGHWNDDPSDVNGYDGSAGGNDAYGDGLGWDFTDWTWTVSAGHTGLVVEVRTYSNPGDTAWIDNLIVVAPDRPGVEVEFPGGYIPVEGSSWSQVKALY